MPGLGPGIHDFNRVTEQDVDGRDKPGHDVGEEAGPLSVQGHVVELGDVLVILARVAEK